MQEGGLTNAKNVRQSARRSGLSNVAFISYFLLGDARSCVEVLKECGRSPEAAFMVRRISSS